MCGLIIFSTLQSLNNADGVCWPGSVVDQMSIANTTNIETKWLFESLLTPHIAKREDFNHDYDLLAVLLSKASGKNIDDRNITSM
jgi:hypothetical protein